MPEQVKFWRSPQRDLELLHARYITHSFSRHTHDTYAIGVIEQGAEAFAYRGGTHVATAGSIVTIHPGEVHTGYAADAAQGWTYRMLYPSVEILRTAIDSRQDLPFFPQPVIHDPPIARLILRLHRALEGNSRLEQDDRLLWTMAQLVSRHAADCRSLPRVGKETQPIQQVRNYLEAHCAENLSLEQLASIANLSPFYLIRAFRRQVGMPPHGYLNQVRLDRARQLLAQGQPIASVAQLTGFSDQSHLTRQFKRMLGVTPGQYQAKGNFA